MPRTDDLITEFSQLNACLTKQNAAKLKSVVPRCKGC